VDNDDPTHFCERECVVECPFAYRTHLFVLLPLPLPVADPSVHIFVLQAELYTPAVYDDLTGELLTSGFGCTNHSIRRSAAQWAGRCDAKELHVCWVGRCASLCTQPPSCPAHDLILPFSRAPLAWDRWKDITEMGKYLSAGCEIGIKAAEDDLSGLDPLLNVWIFFPVVGVSEKGINVM